MWHAETALDPGRDPVGHRLKIVVLPDDDHSPAGLFEPQGGIRVPRRCSRKLGGPPGLAQPFVKRRSMQDLVSTIVETFLEELRDREPGYRKR